MPLFTDGPISSIEDLTAQDSQLLNVASVEGIDTQRKIEIAQEEIAMELLSALKRFGYCLMRPIHADHRNDHQNVNWQ